MDLKVSVLYCKLYVLYKVLYCNVNWTPFLNQFSGVKYYKESLMLLVNGRLLIPPSCAKQQTTRVCKKEVAYADPMSVLSMFGGIEESFW